MGLKALDPTSTNTHIPKDVDEVMTKYMTTHAYWVTMIDMSDLAMQPHGMSNMRPKDVINLLRWQADALEQRMKEAH